MNLQRVDLLLKYVLAAFGQEDFGHREVGSIHLIKYVYLADMAYAEQHEGQTFTGAPWLFHHFGPWSVEVFKRVDPVTAEVGASKRTISLPEYEDYYRWSLVDDELFERLGRELPFVISNTITRMIRRFGSCTPELLHYVYSTPPMVNAAPEELLSFIPAINLPEQEKIDTKSRCEIDQPEKLSSKGRKRRKEALASLREKIQSKLAAKKQERAKLVTPTPPRYDEVFFQGQEWLDSLAGPPIEPQQGELTFSDGVWKSPARTKQYVP